MNKSKLEDDIYHGEHAEALTTNPAFQAALTRLRAGLFEQFGRTGFLQKRKREDLWRMIRTVDLFEEQLITMMEDASLAKDDLKQQERLEKVKSIK